LVKFLDRQKEKGKVHEQRKMPKHFFNLYVSENVSVSVRVREHVYLGIKLGQKEIKKHKFITGQTMTTKTWPQTRRECGTAWRCKRAS